MKAPLLSTIWIACKIAVVSAKARYSPEAHITIINGSPSKVGVWWINPNSSGDNMYIGELAIKDRLPLNSFMGHEFQLRELVDDQTGECNSQDKTCRMTSFHVQATESQFYAVNDYFQIEYGDILRPNESLFEADDYVSYCKRKSLEGASAGSHDKEVILSKFKSCMSNGAGQKLQLAEEEIRFVRDVRQTIGGNMENFTCAMVDAESSPDVSTEEWVSDKDGISRTVHIKFDRPAARIHVIENFATDEECAAYEEEASTKLHRASTADGKGGSQFSLARKALQASIRPKWALEAEGDKIATLSRRVYDYTNHVLGLDLSHEGQEPIMSIQYNGRGLNDTEPDRYTPHCDGECQGNPHLNGGRMATMVIYCTIPEKGGHTNFRNAGVHIKPSVGSAIFFGYIDPVTKVMDTEYTTHSGCPVYEGEKKIITQWVRLGVTKERHSDTINTLGIPHSQSGDD